ncbi:MAG: NAD(P)H-hydrate dehydratase [Tissierellia bacterium]|nr:NAD(P)H-hydrate dehydratase [Tissierellia bacterium]
MIGMDLVKISRVEAIYGRHGERFLKKLFTQRELEFLARRNFPPRTMAGLFAAKEAMAKALGLGISGAGLKNLEIRHRGAVPWGHYRGRIFALSITHEGDYAAASALLLEAGPSREAPFSVDESMRGLLPKLKEDDHKGSRGRGAIIGGSRGMLGSVTLASRAVLRVGAGYSYVQVPEELVWAMELKVTEVIVRGHGEDSGAMDALGLGPGLGRGAEAGELVAKVLKSTRPVVVDADGLYHLGTPMKGDLGPGPRILTPHVGEMSRLTGHSPGEIEGNREAVAGALAQKTGAVVVLKGPGTVVAHGDQIHINATGNPGMATAGSGDVLTGILTGLVAQGMTTYDAARLGVYLHGLAGDLAARALSKHSLTASDILSHISPALNLLE